MKTSFWSRAIILISACVALIGCKDKTPAFTIEGTITDADSTVLYLERRSLNETTIIDSVMLDKEGNFKFTEADPGYPEFYILKLGGQTINLSVDSTETITVKAPKARFALDYSVEGSGSSVLIKEVVMAQNKLSLSFTDLNKRFKEKAISQEEFSQGVQESVEEYKEKARNLIYKNFNSLASYFALFQRVDSYLIFDPYNKKDLALFQAVATVWDQYKSTSPRAEHLKTFTLTALAEIKQMENQQKALENIQSVEVSDHSAYYDFTLTDKTNKSVSLSSLKGKVVILDFTAYKTDFSVARNIAINEVYTKYKENVEVYQISIDTDEHAWRNSAANLPWVCARIGGQMNPGSDVLQKYNVQGIPTTFLINRKGEIMKRMSSSDDLATEVGKIL
ncbi:TlpA disulfide reductase family protein [Dysgonomonas sp. 511]|uniref:TlpA disulfide reductase family protein n=1 Tax=Dysgonomonas sp. 511 TaxID=2302930 RepID=UPI0013D8362E|nr:TlpA disulfide reductase family protein [Dysgonomonas sp. 511]NDV78494.1 AhpC/TSA family protein [Dysgonomonas sp. 511]